jgi:hypothetical protein
MSDCNPIATPMELSVKLSKLERGEVMDSNIYRSITSILRYLNCTSSDIAFVMGVTSLFIEDLKYPYLKLMKRILIYVKRTEDLRLFY